MRSTKHRFLAAAAALLPLMAAACSDRAPTAAAPAEPAAEKQSVYSVVDPATGEPRAINVPASALAAPPAPLAVIDPACDPNFETCDISPPPPTDVCTYALRITGVDSLIFGLEPYAVPEAKSTYKTTCAYQVVTGLGARVDANDNVTTLWIEYGTLNPDGTVTGRHVVKTGSDANHDVEAWIGVPDGVDGSITSVIMGQGGTHNLRTLRGAYQTFGIGSNGKPTLQGVDYGLQGGVDPFSSNIDLSWSAYMPSNQVIIGYGFRSAYYKMRTGHAYVGTIN